MARLNTAQVRLISRVPETSVEAKAAVREADEAAWQQAGELSFAPVATTPPGDAGWSDAPPGGGASSSDAGAEGGADPGRVGEDALAPERTALCL